MPCKEDRVSFIEEKSNCALHCTTWWTQPAVSLKFENNYNEIINILTSKIIKYKLIDVLIFDALILDQSINTILHNMCCLLGQ